MLSIVGIDSKQKVDMSISLETSSGKCRLTCNLNDRVSFIYIDAIRVIHADLHHINRRADCRFVPNQLGTRRVRLATTDQSIPALPIVIIKE
jgi:hypothetical protein